MQLSFRDMGVALVLSLLPFILPIFKFSDLSTLVGATSAIFAIVSGFFIADAMSNYLRLQTLIAEENSALMTIADNPKKMDPDHTAVVYEAIDEYMIAQLDAGTLGHTLETRVHIDKLDNALNSLNAKGDSTLFDHILSASETIRVARQEISLAAKNNLGWAHWSTFITLELVVVTSMLSMRDGGFILNLVIAAVIVSTYAVLILLREIDNNHLLEKKLAFENPRDVFHAIQRPPYYPKYAPKSAQVPDENNQMRLGL